MNVKIEEKLQEKSNEILEFAKSLIKIPTQNPPGENYEKIVSFVRKKLELYNFKIRIYRKNNKPNLVVKWDVGSKKTLHVNGHYDTVPVTPNWKYKQFMPVVKNGKLFGRGSQDMKSSLASMAYAIIILKELNMKPACNIELSFTCDEESGGIDCLGYLVKNKLVKPDYAVIMDCPADDINNAHKGVLALEITVIGKASHAALPQKGVNAFIGACILSKQLNSLNKKLGSIKSKCDANEDAEKSPSLVLGGGIKGGNNFNTVPGEFSFTIDRRVIPEESIENAKKQIINVIRAFQRNNPEYGIKIKTLLEAKPSYVDKKAKISRIFFDSVKKVKNK